MISLVGITFLTTSPLIPNPESYMVDLGDAMIPRASDRALFLPDTFSTIIGSSDLMEEEELVPHPEVWEDGIPKSAFLTRYRLRVTRLAPPRLVVVARY